MLLGVPSLEEDIEVDEVEYDLDVVDDVACNLAVLTVKFVVELVPDMVIFAMLPVPIVEFILEPIIVELLEEAATPVELVFNFDPDAPVGEGEEAVREPVEDVGVDARAARASVGQVEQPPKSWSMPE